MGSYIEVRAKDENQRPAIRDALTRIPGIHHILEVEDVLPTKLHDIFEQTLPLRREARWKAKPSLRASEASRQT
ncbi:hypothetical protein MJ588_06750 [Klebsiella pneumoniae]|nr:hypothetical protein MJ588_06750 [Klebsiella pneumoniae]